MLRLTGRGWAFLGAGALTCIAALLIAQRDVLRLGVLLLMVPLLSAALLQVTPAGVRARRRIEPEQVAPDTPAVVRMQILNSSPTWTRVLLAADELPAAFGRSPRFAVDRIRPGDDLTVTYQLHGAARGVYPIGPLHYRVGDALGMAERRWTYPGADNLVVLPRVHRLDATGLTVTAPGPAELGEAHPTTSGDVDVSTREYRHGDDLRRVHWPSTARHGELMVRREEQSDERLATVLVDVRDAAHDDAGRSDAGRSSEGRGDGRESSLEWAISAAASVCEHLAGRGFAVRLLTDGVDQPWLWPEDDTGRQQRLRRLALLEPLPDHSLAAAVEVVTAQPTGELVVAILGRTDDLALAGLVDSRRGIAMLPAGADGLGTARGLRRAGWACAVYGSDTTVPQAWHEAVEQWRLQTV